MSGTNIWDMKHKASENPAAEDDLMSSDCDEQTGSQILAAIKDISKLKMQPLNISQSINFGMENTQSSIKLQQESQETREVSKLQNSARNHATQVISNRKNLQPSPEDNKNQNYNTNAPVNKVNTIESKTRSMLNAI